MPLTEEEKTIAERYRSLQKKSPIAPVDWVTEAPVSPSLSEEEAEEVKKWDEYLRQKYTPTEEGIERSPVPYEPKPLSAMGFTGHLPESIAEKPTTAEAIKANLSEKGVDIGGEAVGEAFPDVSRFQLSTQVTPEAKRMYLEGKKVKTEIDKDTGTLLYLNPITKRFTPVDELDLSWEDITQDFPSFLPAVTSAVASLLPGGAMSRVTLGALGGVAGKYGQSKLGEAVGSPSPKEEVSKALIEEGRTGIVGGMIGEALPVLTSLRPSSLAGIGRKERERIGERLAETGQDIAKIEQVTGKKLPVSVGEQIDDPRLRAKAAALTEEHYKKLGAKERARREGAQEGLKEYAAKISPPVAGAPEKVSSEATKALADVRKGVQGKIEARVSSAKQEALTPLGDIKDMDLVKTGKVVRRAIRKNKSQIYKEEKELWSKHLEDIGYSAETASSKIKYPIDSGSKLHTELRTISAESKQALTSRIKSKKDKLLAGKLLEILEAPKSPIILPPGVKAPKKKDASIDAYQAKVLLQDLRDWKRTLGAQKKTDSILVRDIDRITDGLLEARAKSLTKQQLAQVEAAEHATRKRKEMFYEGVMGTILRKTRTKSYKMSDDAVFGEIVKKNSPSRSLELLPTLQRSPAALQKVRNGILELYKKEYTERGLPTAKLHEKFMDDYGESIKPYMSIVEGGKISNFGDLAAVVAKEEKKLKNFEASVSKTVLGKAENFNADTFAEDMLKKEFQMTHVNQTKKVLQKHYPDTYHRLQGATAEKIRDSVIKDGKVSHKAIDTLLTKKRSHIATMISPEYVKGLEILSSVSKNLPFEKEPKLNASKELFNLARAAIYGPLDKISTRWGVARILFKGTSERALYNLLSDPKQMEKFIKMENITEDSEKALTFFSQIGIRSEVEEPEEKDK